MNNKRVFYPMVACLLAIVIAVSPAYAYLYYHGYTSSWDRGYATDSWWSGGYAYYDTSTGELGAISPSSQNGNFADAYMNSGCVYAVADCNQITVTFWYENSHYHALLGGSATFEVRLYVNDQCVGIQEINGLSSNGYEQFLFTGLDVHYGDYMDVDASFDSYSIGTLSSASIYATFTYIGFITDDY
jgi:hypothetical protein